MRAAISSSDSTAWPSSAFTNVGVARKARDAAPAPAAAHPAAMMSLLEDVVDVDCDIDFGVPVARPLIFVMDNKMIVNEHGCRYLNILLEGGKVLVRGCCYYKLVVYVVPQLLLSWKWYVCM